MTEPSRLLAGRRGLSRPEKDAILDGVLARVERRSLKHGLVIGALAVGATASTLVFVHRERDEITAKGSELAAGFEITCVPAPCATGSKLVFDITSTGGATYFAAFAHGGDAMIWYFPTSRRIPDGGGVLDTGIVLGPEHAPGTYTIEGVFSSEPLDCDEIRRTSSVKREVVIR